MPWQLSPACSMEDCLHRRWQMKKLQILGPGCSKCKMLAAHAEAAARDLGLEYVVEKIADINTITEFGVMVTPALAVDGKVVVSGRVPTTEQIKRMLA